MRRPDIKLLALARQGDATAALEVGRRYLLGAEGFPHHVATAIEYLARLGHHTLQDKAAILLAEALPLEEILGHQQEAVLARAAGAQSVAAAFKHGVWLCVQPGGRTDEGMRWVQRAASGGSPAAQRAIDDVRAAPDGDVAHALLVSGTQSGTLDGATVALLAARRAHEKDDGIGLIRTLRTLLRVRSPLDEEACALIAAAVAAAERSGRDLNGIAPGCVEAALEHEALRGNRHAAHALGRALCGLDVGGLAPAALVTGANLRKGVALLLRAADAGTRSAWLDLYHMHADQRQSVANPQLALFCLEKAAHGGQLEAQRKLGAVLLKNSDSLQRTEEAIAWLSMAAAQADAQATELLRSLVLPRKGDDASAREALAAVRDRDPRLAARMDLARHFGLTKLEALCVDPLEGVRPWGLVIGRNPFVAKARLSAPRAIPAVDEAARHALRSAVDFFANARGRVTPQEGDFRRRSGHQRRLFAELDIDESLFFVAANASMLDAMRQGPKWAFRARRSLQAALAASLPSS